ncbi:unnamed protein product [Effrenium voratum]|nr:unnamed protein product [Effrenium voratum]
MRAVSILCAVLIASAERPHRFDEVLRDPGSERSEATTEKKAAKPKAKATTTTEASPVENVVLADGAKAEQEEERRFADVAVLGAPLSLTQRFPV